MLMLVGRKAARAASEAREGGRIFRIVAKRNASGPLERSHMAVQSYCVGHPSRGGLCLLSCLSETIGNLKQNGNSSMIFGGVFIEGIIVYEP